MKLLSSLFALTSTLVNVLLLAATPQCAAQERPSSQGTTSLVRISPEGSDVPKPSQIVLQFSGPVVPLGKMARSEQEISVTISPPLACQWRWLNSTALACNLDHDKLPRNASRYEVIVPPIFDRSSNISLPKGVSHSFTTARPAVTNSWFESWSSPGLPQISLTTNQSVVADSLARLLYFKDARGKRYSATTSEILPSRDEPATGDNDSELSQENPGTLWRVTPASELPPDTDVRLMIAPGLRSSEGQEVGVEDRVLIEFQTFPAPRFLGISCTGTNNETRWISSSRERGAASHRSDTLGKRCDPLRPITMVFNSPVLKDQIAPHLRLTPDPRAGRAELDLWQDVRSYSHLSAGHSKGQRYSLSLPYGLKAFTSYSIEGQGSLIHDEFGRPLVNDISASFSTDHRRARYAFDTQFTVLEKDADSQLPVVVNNLQALTLSYQALTTSSNLSNQLLRLEPPQAQDIAYHYPIDVRKILNGGSGVVQGTLSTNPKTEQGSRWFLSQVTPFSVHFKLGHFNSLAWITSFKTGEPIRGAKVSLLIDTLTALSSSPKELATGITGEDGTVHLAGTESLDPKLELINQWETNKPRLLVRVEKDGDMALLPISWDVQVYSDAVYPSTQEQYGHVHAWGTTAQGLYKAGDAVQFSIWVRNQDSQTLTAAPRQGYSLKVLDPTDAVVFELPSISLSEFGGFSGEFSTKPNAVVGWYRFVLSSSLTQTQWYPLRVLVSDFAPAPCKVSTELTADRFRNGDEVQITTLARLHAGGPYADAPSRVHARIKAAPLPISSPALERFTFESDLQKDVEVFETRGPLSRNGDRTSSFKISNADISFGNLIVESSVSDDRGKSVSDSVRKPFYGRDRYVGVAQADWILSVNREATSELIAIDDNLRVSAGNSLQVTWQFEETKAARVKSAGNVYTTRYEQQFVDVHSCNLTSGEEAVRCSYTPRQPGRYKITGTVKDSAGRAHQTSMYRWAAGAGDVVWSSGAHDELPIVPEKRSYRVGETARFFIRNPFSGTTALLTTERYGVQRHWQQKWPDSSAIVEFPITAEHIPGFFFSATVTSPRVAAEIQNQVDLGKPSFKLGYAAIDVIDATKQLTVAVKPLAATYKPKEAVTVELTAQPRQGMPKPIQFAVTVLDESVFDLIADKRNYFDPYRGFYQLDGLDVRNYSLIKLLVGRQKFEKKGANAGGDGGTSLDFRSLRKFVAYWNPALHADEHGRARISFEAPENLTGWKVFAIALTQDDQMGLGEGLFTVQKQVEIRPALPNLVREGDSFNAVFTVMNRDSIPRDLTVEASLEGQVGEQGASATATPLRTTIHALPFKRYPIILATSATNAGQVRYRARAYDTQVSDSVAVTLPILERSSLVTASSFGSSDGKAVEQTLIVPRDNEPKSASLSVTLSRSLLGSLEGSFRYMHEYPYGCWEQRLSKAVAAAHSILLKDYLPQSFHWSDATQTVTSTLSSLPEFQAPSGAMGFYSPLEQHSDPYLSAYTAYALNWLRDAGYSAASDAEKSLCGYVASLLKNDVFPEHYSPAMRISTRAIGLAALARRNLATSSDMTRLQRSLPLMDLFGKAMFLEAAVVLKAPAELQRRVAHQIVSHANETDGTLTLHEDRDVMRSRMLDTETRTQCAVLGTLLHTSEYGDPQLRAQLTQLIPKLARSISLARKGREHWNNTQENAVCIGALAHYSRVYEADSSEIAVSVTDNTDTLGTLLLSGKTAPAQEVRRTLPEREVGVTHSVRISPSTQGRFYYTTRVSYADRSKGRADENAGIEVHRELSVKRGESWILLPDADAITQGELVKVDIFVHTPTVRNFVVVDDPLPGGLEALNRELATTSEIDTQSSPQGSAPNSRWWSRKDWLTFGASLWGFYHSELRHQAVRFYSEHLPAGHYHLSYLAQAIAPGTFTMPALQAHEMYDPQVFGRTSARTLRIEATP